ncbi:MAG: hypothetical protein GX661_00710 [Acholeplasmataceae bacterium]|nr:hypothetical protein [Acholeplasmataceae bacterium]
MLEIWFLDVGHGDCAYMQLPNGSRMMIDCGCTEDHWPSRLLKYYSVSKEKPISIPGVTGDFGIDNLVISHPHGDHIADIKAIHDEVKFYLLSGGYSGFIDKITDDQIDFRKRGKVAAEEFRKIVKKYCGTYVQTSDRIANEKPICTVNQKRFIDYVDGIDLNEISYFVSFSIGGHKVLFPGDMTAKGIRKIIESPRKDDFLNFVKGTTILKIPHHARENGCSEELFAAFGTKPLLCIASDEVLNDRNEGTSSVDWYNARTSDKKVLINGELQNRKVLTTRKDKDIYVGIDTNGNISVKTNCFSEVKATILAT